MKREIKFKVWNHGINKMYDVYGFNDRQIQWRNESGGLGGSFSYGKNNKNKFTLLQFTGHSDTEDQEIYESDIVQDTYNKRIFVIKWNNESTGFIAESSDHIVGVGCWTLVISKY